MRLVLFDIDGTLLKTRGVGRLTTRAAMLEVFGTASTIDTHHFGGKTDWRTLIELLSGHGYTAERIGERMGEFVEAMGRHMARLIGEHPAEPLPGALEAVQRARSAPGMLAGLVTGNAPTSAVIKLQSAGFSPEWFMCSAFGSEAVDRAELPRLAHGRASAACGCAIAPENCVIIGDTLMDIEAARANGMRVIAVKTGFEDAAALAGAQPDYLLDDLTGLFGIPWMADSMLPIG